MHSSFAGPGRVDELPTVKQMVEALDRFVVGQARAKLDLATAVYAHYLILQMNDADGDGAGSPPRQNLMLLGPTGSGKTHMVRTLAGALNVPFMHCAANSLVATGYVGDHVESVLTGLYRAADGLRGRAERGIVFIDEIDKIRRTPGGGRDVNGEAVQNALLAILDGGEVSFPLEKDGERGVIDVSKVLFICAGAFARLPEVIRARLAAGEQGGFGFAARGKERGTRGRLAAELASHELMRHWENGDLRDFGLIPEFVGRFSCITALDELKLDDLVRLVQGVEGSPIDVERARFRRHGIELAFEPDAARAVAEEALRLRTGARGLKRAVMRALDPVDYRVAELAADGVTHITFSRAAVQGLEPPSLVKGERLYDAGSALSLRRSALAPSPLEAGEDDDPAFTAPGFIDSSGMSKSEINELFAERAKPLKDALRPGTSAARWWDALVARSSLTPAVKLRLVEELLLRGVGIEEFFNAYSTSQSDNVAANFFHLDAIRIKAWRLACLVAAERGNPPPPPPRSWPDDPLLTEIIP